MLKAEKSKSISALLIFTLFFFGSLSTLAQPYELCYDDGGCEYGWSDFYPMGATVKFSPPSQFWRLKAVRFYAACYLGEGDGQFYVEISDANLNVVYKASKNFREFFEGRNTTLDWFEITVPDLILSGGFYVTVVPSLAIEGGSMLWVGADENEPVENRGFLIDTISRAVVEVFDARSRRPKDFMIRALGEPAQMSPELKLVPVEPEEDHTGLLFEILGASAKGVRATVSVEGASDEAECRAMISESSKISVSVPVTPGPALLRLSVSTDMGTVCTSLRLGGELRLKYKELFERYWELGNTSASATKEAEELRSKVSGLSAALGQMGSFVSVLENRISSLKENNTELAKRVESLSGEVSRLSVALAGAVVVIAALSLLEVRRRWASGRS